MEKGYYSINGGKKLCGTVTPQGSKNAALPIIAATMLCGSEFTLKNVPDILDVKVLCDILRVYGAKIRRSGGELYIDSRNIYYSDIPSHLTVQLRSSSYLLGCLLPVIGKLKLPLTGGCRIGARPLDIHLSAAQSLGVVYNPTDDLLCWNERTSAKINFKYPSVGATINTVMLASGINGLSVIKNAAKEPESTSLIDFLNFCGAEIYTNRDTITVNGGRKLHGCVYTIPCDRIVAGDILLAVAATGGECEIIGVPAWQLASLTSKMSKSSCKIQSKGDRINMSVNGPLFGEISTAPFPYFPTDLQAQFVCACASSGGRAVVRENVFGSRFAYSDELKKMGADPKIGGHTLLLKQSKLHGAEVMAPDLRGGAALIIAGLATCDNTKVGNLRIVDRGYENLCTLYNSLGGDIKRIE